MEEKGSETVNIKWQFDRIGHVRLNKFLLLTKVHLSIKGVYRGGVRGAVPRRTQSYRTFHILTWRVKTEEQDKNGLLFISLRGIPPPPPQKYTVHIITVL